MLLYIFSLLLSLEVGAVKLGIAALTSDMTWYTSHVIWDWRQHFCCISGREDIYKKFRRSSPEQANGLFLSACCSHSMGINVLSHKSKPWGKVQIPPIEPMGHLCLNKTGVRKLPKAMGFSPPCMYFMSLDWLCREKRSTFMTYGMKTKVEPPTAWAHYSYNLAR